MEEPMVIENNPNYYSFEFISAIYYLTNKLEVQIKLPSKCYIHEETVPAYYPYTEFIFQDTDRTYIIWINYILASSSNHIFFVRFDPPLESQSLIWVLVTGPVLAFVAGVGSTIWISKRRERKAVKKVGEIFLNESQKRLLQTIIENGGKISQKELISKTEFTRSKTSRNLINLENQGLIMKEKWGRNQVVYITKTGEKMIE
jgi:uncharacterized membrane protein